MRFEVWAPRARLVEIEIDGKRHALEEADGHWSAEVDAPHGTPYGYVLDGEGPFPDPRSSWQPDGVHGLSRVYDHELFPWTDEPRRPYSLDGVVYELHIGTFTEEGTFDGAIERLGHLVDLGVTFVELMPVAAFPGRNGWGYDGVHPGAVHEPYGGPDGLKRFVNACHALGLGVLLDVVYNHLGPDGNHLGRYGPYFTDAHGRTPWGSAVNLDQAGSDEVRGLFLANAASWLRDFHFDGLRLDAVHAYHDTRAQPFLEELGALDGVIIAESDLNDPRLVASREAGGLGLDGVWSDDLHHALHALLTGERHGYYADFGTVGAVAKALESVYVHDGAYSAFRGRSHGRPVDPRIPPERFVVSLQNHDQIGNRPLGDRLPRDLLLLGSPLTLLAPYTPLIFQGEEWGASTPFAYFTEHTDPELGRAVTEGRRREHGHVADVPDPQDPATHAASILDWDEAGVGVLTWHRTLIALRGTAGLEPPRVTYDERARWLVMDRGPLRVAVNFDAEEAVLPGGGVLRLASSGEVELDGEELRLPGMSSAVIVTG
ncbi:malto-oligosyltrehalose trehalohydrolase [Actinocorallia longicatena]|uniref:Malto-oligosyltrehalose trehalohydrolase n=1 Tax=Actinocorallia longicatena TaxID=111803 RepID=A0ABP6QNM5_9ACTN